MPNMENPEELADWIADKIGVYEDPECDDQDHDNGCSCRVVWVPRMAERIRQSVENEKIINRGVNQ